MKYIFISIVVGVIFGGFVWLQDSKIDSVELQFAEENNSLIKPVEKKEVVKTYTVQTGDTFTKAVESFGISYAEALAIVSAGEFFFDFTDIKINHLFRYVTDQSAEFLRLEYDISSEEMAVVTKNGGDYSVRVEKIAYETTAEKKTGKIESSLFLSGSEAGLSDKLILELAEIFAWTIDFATEVQQDDQFVVVYEKRVRDGQEAGTGNILVATFTNNGKQHIGYRFELGTGEVSYYDEDGNSLVKQFLKAPLTYNRITSGYTTARFHPVTGTTMPHKAIDYGAAVGTPVLSVGDGVVTVAKYNGGFGNYIDVRHNATYETQYAHLSSYAKGIKPGVKVQQGQVIGYVGSTGWSTGPHLHYQIRVNGVLMNPLEVELPAGDPIPDLERERFEKMKLDYNNMLK